MHDLTKNTLMIESVNQTLKDALLELRQQLANLETIISHHHHLLLNHVVKFKEQTIDFLYDLEPISYRKQEDQLFADINVSFSSLNNTSPNFSKSPPQNIVIKVSNHHYVPKYSHTQTIVTYKFDS